MNMVKEIEMFFSNIQKNLSLAACAVLTVGILCTADAASAQGAFYFKNSAHTYYVWGSRESCDRDWAGSGKSCVSWGTPKCGGRLDLWSVQSTLNVANSKYQRDHQLRINLTETGRSVCVIE